MGDQRLSGLISGAVRVRAGDRVRARARGGIRAGIAVRRDGHCAGTTRVRVTVLGIQINLHMGARIGYGFRSRLHLGIRRGIEGESVILARIGRGIGRYRHFRGSRRLGRPGKRC